MEGTNIRKAEGNEKSDRQDQDDIFSKVVRAGKRTYFFDVKATKGKDYYLTITESKKRFNKDGGFFYEKHKLFLYKEDFEKFSKGLEEAISKIAELRGEENEATAKEETSATLKDEPIVSDDSLTEQEKFTEVNFEDLGS